MVSAVVQELQTPQEGIWIDQCSIDQDNAEEKAVVIEAMDHIYQSARVVFALLEDVRLTHEQSIALKRMLAWYDGMNGQHPKYEHKEDLDILSHTLIHIMSARWFRRAWCSHELQLCESCQFFIPTGLGIMSFQPIEIERLYSVTIGHIESNEELDQLYLQHCTSYDFLQRALFTIDKARDQRSLMSEFAGIEALGCLITSDKVSICLNVGGMNLAFRLHESKDITVAECRFMLSLLALASGDVSSLCGVDDSLDLDAANGRFSWMWWTYEAESTNSLAHNHDLSTITSVTQDEIILDVFNIESCHFQTISEDVLGKCAAVLGNVVQHLMGNDFDYTPHWMTLHEEANEFQNMFSYMVQYMACAAHCGLNWVLQQNFGSPAEIKRRFEIYADDEKLNSCCPIWLETLGLLSVQDYADLDALSRSIILLFFLQTIFNGPIDDRAYARPTLLCWIDLGNGVKAILERPPKISEQCRHIVPVVLSVPGASRARRLWSVKRTYLAQEECWVVIHKSRFVTLNQLLLSNKLDKARSVKVIGQDKMLYSRMQDVIEMVRSTSILESLIKD